MLTLQLHIHTIDDPLDNCFVKYSIHSLIDKAVSKKIDVLAVTCHKKFVDLSKYRDYAKERGILLVEGIELSINKNHVVVLNCDESVEKIQSFNDLKEYKKNNPQIFILAPHPYFVFYCSLGSNLIKHIDLFDGIEYSYCYTKLLNFNKKAEKVAKDFNKPLIGTSDVHNLHFIDKTITRIDTSLDVKSIIEALKNGKNEIHTAPLNLFDLSLILWMIFYSLLTSPMRVFKK